MCYLTLTLDHRALDAFQANAFLSLVVETLEQWPGIPPKRCMTEASAAGKAPVERAATRDR